jgi:hypothetical protein
MNHKKVFFEPVKSSTIAEIGHVKEDLTLYVKFKNNELFSYAPVSTEDYKSFKESDSIGSYFHKNLKTNSTLKINNESKKVE